MNTYQKGNTVTMTALFVDADTGNPIVLENPVLKIYNNSRVETDQITLDSNNINENGAYFYKYIFSITGKFYYEFSGDIDTNTYLKRGELEVNFM